MPVALSTLSPDLRSALQTLHCWCWPTTEASVRRAFFNQVRHQAEDDDAGLLVLLEAKDTIETALDLGLPVPPARTATGRTMPPSGRATMTPKRLTTRISAPPSAVPPRELVGGDLGSMSGSCGPHWPHSGQVASRICTTVAGPSHGPAAPLNRPALRCHRLFVSGTTASPLAGRQLGSGLRALNP
jgi:hypothetical protein